MIVLLTLIIINVIFVTKNNCDGLTDTISPLGQIVADNDVHLKFYQTTTFGLETRIYYPIQILN